MSLRQTLQSDVFSAQKERLLHTIPVTRASKRKKHALLCIAANNEGNEIFIYKIKKHEKNEVFKKIACWPLTSLKKIDGHIDIQDSLQFDIYFEKAYMWEAGNLREKDLFLNTLYKICKRHLAALDMMPEFVNMPAHLEDEIQGAKDLFLTTGGHSILATSSPITAINSVDEMGGVGQQQLSFASSGHSSPYQLVSSKEEADLQRIMAQFEYGQNMLSNVEAFSEKLAKELNILDGANIYSLMGSEDSMGKLMGLVDGAINEVSSLERKLSDWDTCVSSMRGHMEMMDEKDTSLHIIDKNKSGLQQELTTLLESLEYPSHFKRTLNEVDLNYAGHLKECIRAASELQKAINASQSNVALKKMAAVQEKFNELDMLKNNFSKRLLQHLASLFSKIVGKMNETSPTTQSTLNRSPSGAGLPYGSGEWGVTGLREHTRLTQPGSSVAQDRRFSLSGLHSKYKRESLLAFKELIKWLKTAAPDVYVDLLKAYGHNFGRVYEKGIHEFFDRAKQIVSTQCAGQSAVPPPTKAAVSIGSGMVRTGSFRSTTAYTSPLSERKKDWFEEIAANKTSSPTSTSTSSKMSSVSPHTWDHKFPSGGSVDFNAVLDRVITSVAIMVKDEQDFASDFFDLSSSPQVALQSEIPLQSFPLVEEATIKVRPSNVDLSPVKLGAGILSPQSSPKPLVFRADMNEKELLILLFPSLPLELDNFLQVADRIDKFYSIQALVRFMATCLHHVEPAPTSQTPNLASPPQRLTRLSRGSMANQSFTLEPASPARTIKISTENSSYLRLIFLNCTVTSKRYMDKFMNAIIRSMEETKASKKNKNGGGFLPFVSEFPNLAENLEAIFRQGEPYHRKELDKWYTILVRSIYNNINRIAVEHPKLPRDVVLFENYHSMYTALSSLKIAHLEMERKEAKVKYKQHIYSYVESILGKPLEKLNTFFEGIENKVSQGIKESEIGYQIAFSKTELKKVIRDYPGKEVKRQLESLYKLVEKHVGEDNSLLQVVWRSVQEEFIKHYKNLEGLIAKCYPNSQITLEFSLTELLQYFSDIAQQH